MPFVQIHMLDKHRLSQKRRLVKTVADAVTASLGVPREHVNIILSEMAPDTNAVGGVLIKDMKKTKKKNRR